MKLTGQNGRQEKLHPSELIAFTWPDTFMSAHSPLISNLVGDPRKPHPIAIFIRDRYAMGSWQCPEEAHNEMVCMRNRYDIWSCFCLNWFLKDFLIPNWVKKEDIPTSGEGLFRNVCRVRLKIRPMLNPSCKTLVFASYISLASIFGCLNTMDSPP